MCFEIGACKKQFAGGGKRFLDLRQKQDRNWIKYVTRKKKQTIPHISTTNEPNKRTLTYKYYTKYH